MIEWLSVQYLQLIANFKILLANPSGCYAVNFLQTAALTLLALLGLKLAVHVATVRWLKSQFPRYSGNGPASLMRSYRQLASEAGLKRIPRLYRFADRRPLAFAIGVWRPAVFLAPRLAEQLPEPELRAVLAHELTHIRRRDNLRTWLLEAFYALIPALVVQFFGLQFIFSGRNSELAVCGALTGLLLFRLLLWKPIQALREQTCDDLTVDLVRDPLVLASSLVSTWRLSREIPRLQWGYKLALVEPFLPWRGGLEARVRRLLNYRRPRWKFLLARAAKAICSLLALLLTVFLLQFYLRGQPVEIPGDSDCTKVYLAARQR